MLFTTFIRLLNFCTPMGLERSFTGLWGPQGVGTGVGRREDTGMVSGWGVVNTNDLIGLFAQQGHGLSQKMW